MILVCHACSAPITDGRFDLMYWSGANHIVCKGGCPDDTQTTGADRVGDNSNNDNKE